MLKRPLSNLNRYISLPIIAWIASTQAIFAQGATGATTAAQATAAGGTAWFGFPTFTSLLADGAAWVSSTILSFMSLWVTLTGALLNVSITMTLHIKDFVDSTPGVYDVWQTIRDISGMFIIFMLLYASFMLILSKGDAGSNVGKLIKNVVIVGVMINFSFFAVSLLIDASNIVSLALYNAIVNPTVVTTSPQTLSDCGQTTGTVNTCAITSQMMRGTSGGLSDIFLNYLKPQSIYNPAGQVDPTLAAQEKPLQIMIQGIVGTIIMFTVGLSFLLASLAFVVRLIVLVILLAFSPIWFASWVIPQLKDHAKHFTDQLKAQLVFMPVYLLLLYAALRVLSSASSIFTNPSGVAFSGTGAGFSFIPVNYIVLAINDFFIVFLLNLPLVTAFSMGGFATKWVKTDKFDAKRIWGGIGNTAQGAGKVATGFVGRNTLGRAASNINESLANTWAGNTILGRDIRSATVGKIAEGKYGGKRSFSEQSKLQKDVNKKQNEIDRRKDLENLLAGVPVPGKNIKDVLDSMSEKERLSLGKDTLMKEDVVRHLKKGDFEAIKKSEDLSLEDQKAIAKQRKTLFENAVKFGSASKDPKSLAIIKDMAKNWSAEDIAGMDESILTTPEVIEHMSAEHLKKIADSNASSGTKTQIANVIKNWKTTHGAGKQHRAFGYIKKNKDEWS